MAVFNERLEAGDLNLLKEGNHTGAESIEVIKKAGRDVAKLDEAHENIFAACRTIAAAYRQSDVTSKIVKGW